MIDFSTLQGLTIPEGVVTKIESGGVVLWELKTGGGPVILEVEKYTSDTYAGETTYKNESFILLDIYPKTNGTVKVTYGGLTKTITDTSGAEEPNVQQVFFGTFNGVTDSVETPSSGKLTIEGSYYAFGAGEYNWTSKSNAYSKNITAIEDFGGVKVIPDYAFYQCTKITNIEIPSDIVSIGAYAFFGCESVPYITILATTPPTIGNAVFSTGSTEFENPFPIIVPVGCGEAYKVAEGWSEYADYIVEAS